MDADWRHLLLVCSALGEDDVELVRREQVPMRSDLFDLFELDELKSAAHRRRAGRTPREGIDVTSHWHHFRVWRGDAEDGELVDYPVEVNEGEVVLDIIHRLQQTRPDRGGTARRQVRLVRRRDQRSAPADVHDPDEHVR